MREPTLLDMEAWLHDRIEASTEPHLPPKFPEQNQHHLKQGHKCNRNTGVHTTGINLNKESKPFEKKLYFVEQKIEFKSVKGTKP